MNNLISIIVPTKNGEKYIKEALENIKKQGMDVQIILVDDGSDDNTSQIAKDFDCMVLRNDVSKGPVVAKNMALDVASGKYVMFHDHDDVMREGTLLRLYEALENNTEIDAVMAKVQDFFSPEINEEERAKTAIKAEPYFGLFTGAVLMKKSVFDTIGKFNEKVTAGEIIDWQSKMQANNLKIEKLDFVATNRRIHTTNFGKTQQKTEFKDYATLLRAKLSRKNPTGGGA